MDRMGSDGHQGGPEMPPASSRACFGPIGGRLKNRLLDMGLKGFRTPARTVTVRVEPDGPNGVLRAPRRPGGASGILSGLLWPHRRSVEKPTAGFGAKGLKTPLHEGGLKALRPPGQIVPGEPCTDFR